MNLYLYLGLAFFFGPWIVAARIARSGWPSAEADTVREYPPDAWKDIIVLGILLSLAFAPVSLFIGVVVSGGLGVSPWLVPLANLWGIPAAIAWRMWSETDAGQAAIEQASRAAQPALVYLDKARVLARPLERRIRVAAAELSLCMGRIALAATAAAARATLQARRIVAGLPRPRPDGAG